MKNLIILISIVSFSATAEADSVYHSKQRVELLKECQNNKLYLDRTYNIYCGKDFHHYNSTAYKKFYSRTAAIKNGKVKISEFNALHPGMGKSRFKDYKKVAQIINQFDIIGVTELISLMSADLSNNKTVISFLETTPNLIKDLKKQIRSLETSINNSRRNRTAKKRELSLLKKKLLQIKEDMPDVKSLYRTPGYLKILDELHKLRSGSSWALVLSPSGEGSATTPVPELTGYYYRSNIVKPKKNSYCKAIACTVKMNAEDMGEDKRDAFARRPFMGEFISGKFSFALITSHVLFDEPNSIEVQETILRKAFNVSDYRELGIGASKDKYARFAEVKMTLDFIQSYIKTRGSQKDTIFMGDLNLESTNKFWPKVLSSWKGSKLFVEGKTTVSKARFDKDGIDTFGKSSNYDHFIFDPKVTKECIKSSTKSIDGGVYDFINGKISGYLNRIYKVRNENYNSRTQSYQKNEKRYKKALQRFVDPKSNGSNPIMTIGTKYVTIGKYRMKSVGIIEDKVETKKYAIYFKERIMDSQLIDKTYYYYFMQLLSDHYPIHMSCTTK